MRQASLAAFLLGAGAALGCAALLSGGRPPAALETPVLAGPTPWTGTTPLREAGEFDFAVVGDRTARHRDGVFEVELPPRLNLVRPEFVVSVGDLIEGYSEDRAQLAREWDELATAVAKLRMPFFYVPGNHDISNALMAEVWRSRFGPSFYHFRYQQALFLVLDSELFGVARGPDTTPGPSRQEQQMAYVESVLREHAGARWTFVFLHRPLWNLPPESDAGPPAEIPADWRRVETLLGSRPYTVFAGHFHRYRLHVRHGRQFITLATTGGASELRGTAFGEFDHVAFVTLTRDGPQIANLRLDGILPADVVSAERAPTGGS
jgi:hypothetical protein